jgi:hypothetical protein
MHRCALFLAIVAAMQLSAADKVTAGEFYVERPTLIALGFEWSIAGDDNRNASVAVSYRKKGDPRTLPLFEYRSGTNATSRSSIATPCA